MEQVKTDVLIIGAGAAGSMAAIKASDFTKDIIAWDGEEDRPYVKYPGECQLCFICQVECPAKAVKVKIPLAFW